MILGHPQPLMPYLYHPVPSPPAQGSGDPLLVVLSSSFKESAAAPQPLMHELVNPGDCRVRRPPLPSQVCDMGFLPWLIGFRLRVQQ